MMSASGQSLPGRASSKSGHVRYASTAEVHSELGGYVTHWTWSPRSGRLKGVTVTVIARPVRLSSVELW